MNIELIRKIESSCLLESKGSWGSGIMGMAVAACKLKDSSVRLRYYVFSIAQIPEPSSIPSLTR